MKSERYSKFLAGLVTSLIIFSLFISPALAAAGDTTRVTVASDETQWNNEVGEPSISTTLNFSPLMFIENVGQFGSSASLPMPAAFAQADQAYGMGFQTPSAVGTDVWTSIGPEGGCIRALAIDPATPNTLYAGTWGGGVFSIQQGGVKIYLPLILRNG